MNSDRIASILSLIIMIPIWLGASFLLFHVFEDGKPPLYRTVFGLVVIVVVIALWVLIPIQIIQHYRKRKTKQ